MGGTSDNANVAHPARSGSGELRRAPSDAEFLADDDGRYSFVGPSAEVSSGNLPVETAAIGRLNALLTENLFDAAELNARRELHTADPDIARGEIAARGDHGQSWSGAVRLSVELVDLHWESAPEGSSLRLLNSGFYELPFGRNLV